MVGGFFCFFFTTEISFPHLEKNASFLFYSIVQTPMDKFAPFTRVGTNTQTLRCDGGQASPVQGQQQTEKG